jgi:voltage-dependent calcium channel L type alpha-1D
VGDGWNDVMYSCIRAVGWTSTIYFVSLVIIGNIILINLFLAILIGNFEEASILMKEM